MAPGSTVDVSPYGNGVQITPGGRTLQRPEQIHRELALLGVSGGATCDGLVALAARDHGAVLATRDARARSTSEAIEVHVELLTDVRSG